jgi:hypothetical protein
MGRGCEMLVHDFLLYRTFVLGQGLFSDLSSFSLYNIATWL